jgi:crotonobetainyl-CoA:carnitine CoA-transferase CaiB-like acyl-CoA transferase
MAGGMYTAIGVLGALVERAASGQGQYVDVAMLDAHVALLENAVVRYFATGEVPGRIGSRHPLIAPFQAFETADGWLVVASVKDWALFCGLLGVDELAVDGRFATNPLRTANHAALEPLLQAAFRRRPTADWLTELPAACLVAPLQTIDQMAHDPQVLHRGMFADLPSAAGPVVRVASSPVKYSRTPVELRAGPDAPGGYTDTLLTQLGFSGEQIAALRADGVVG